MDLQEKNGTFVYSVPFSDEQGGSLAVILVCQMWRKDNLDASHLVNVVYDCINRNTVLLCQQLMQSIF